jgi:hypothetical protein
MDHQVEIWIKGALALAALVVLRIATRDDPTLVRRQSGFLLGATAFLAVMAYYNFGAFHGRGYVHHWETFHYVLGSKYFPELGYDGLYVASIAAESEAFPGKPLPSAIRDLRTNEVIPTRTAEWHRGEVKRRFSRERWRQFVADHRYFVEVNDPSYLARIRTDHGYNPTPAWTFVARLFDGWLGVNAMTMPIWGSLDLVLLATAFGFLIRTYGTRAGALALVLFGLGYAWRFDWVGGAFLRQDWLAAVVIAVCMVKKERFVWAGFLLGYAASVRLFPAAFLFGPAVLFVRALVRREETAWMKRLGAGVLLALVLGGIGGSMTGRGPGAWKEFGENFDKHRKTWLTNNVGFKNVLLYGPETIERRTVDFTRPEPWERWQKKMDQMEADRKPLLVAATLLWLGAIGFAAWNASREEALLLGIPALFSVGVLTCYYWMILSAVPLVRRRWLVEGVLATSVVLFVADLLTPSFEAIYGLASWLLSALFAVWVFQAARGVSEGSSSDSGCSPARRTKRDRPGTRNKPGRGPPS